MALIYTRIYAQPVEFNRALGYAYDALVKGPYPFDAMSTWNGLSERVARFWLAGTVDGFCCRS